MSDVTSQKDSELYEFGPFRMDAGREVVFRDGHLIALTSKTFQVLLVLVRRSGELVSKDELMKAVWPDTFVEETNLTRNIFSLRKALGDSPENPYVVTVSGKGYRLATTARRVADQQVAAVAGSRSTVEVHIETRSVPRWAWAVGTAIAVTLLVAGLVHVANERLPALTEKDSVLIADFANSTGDEVFDETLRQGLAVQLQQSPYLQIISDARIQHTLGMMGKPAGTRLTGATGRELCARVGASAVLEGSIALLGSRYVLGLRATNCGSGDIIADQQEQSADKDHVLDALGAMATNFRTRMGESSKTVREHDKPLEQATTPSLEALRAFSLGMRMGFAEGFVSAEPLLQRATSLDPQFALAHAQLGLMYYDSGQSELARESASKAYELRDRVSDRERFLVALAYDRIVTGNLERARQTAELWTEVYPRDAIPHGLLSGGITQAAADFPQSIEHARRAIDLDPDLGPAYVNFAFTEFALGHLDDATRLVQRAAERGLMPSELLVLPYYISFVRRDAEGMRHIVQRAQGKAWAEDWIAEAQALAAAGDGQLVVARDLSQRAVQLALQAGQRERAASYEASAARYEGLVGNSTEARAHADAALALSRGRDTEYTAAFALAIAGDVVRTESLLQDLETRFPENSVAQRIYLPGLRGLVAVQRRDFGRAIDVLTPALAGEMAIVGDGFAVMGNVDSAYVRGLAYLGAGQPANAMTEFQKLVDHPGIVFDDPVGTIVRLQIGRACAAVGDGAKARSVYDEFLRRWQDALPSVPLLEAARAEYAALR
jgi:DNA-binding winged helix-turn-helix (wHTH) protein/tetratricopeptide (TPR) repeat protein